MVWLTSLAGLAARGVVTCAYTTPPQAKEITRPVSSVVLVNRVFIILLIGWFSKGLSFDCLEKRAYKYEGFDYLNRDIYGDERFEMGIDSKIIMRIEMPELLVWDVAEIVTED